MYKKEIIIHKFTKEDIEYIYEVMDMANDHGIVMYGNEEKANAFLKKLEKIIDDNKNS